MSNDPRRRHMRLQGYDYTQAGAYGVIVLADQPAARHGIPEIVRGFKTFSARRINEGRKMRGALWQRGYYEHVIRNERALDRIRGYIASNPARWADDPDNPWRAGSAAPGQSGAYEQ